MLIPEGVSENFVMEHEQGRGLIRLCGWGQGGDRHDGGLGLSSPASSASTGSGDSADSPVPASAPSPPEGFWGMGFGLPLSESARLSDDHPGGLNVRRELDFDRQKIFDLVEQYLRHLHILHPFLDQNVLKRMIRSFTDKYSPKKDQSGSDATVNQGKKRKQSFDDSIPPTSRNASSPRMQPAVERSVGNAIVLLVVALGKICAWKRPLPGFVTPAGSFPGSSHPGAFSPQLINPGIQSPISNTNGYASPASGHLSSPSGLGNRTIPIDRHEIEKPRNVDVIPGLAYYTLACDILGEVVGGTDLSYAQACLLAGLYAGQLAHPITSHAHICQAARACQVLVNS